MLQTSCCNRLGHGIIILQSTKTQQDMLLPDFRLQSAIIAALGLDILGIIAGANVEEHSGKTGLMNSSLVEPHPVAERNHQSADRQRMIIGQLIAQFAAHQPVKGLGIALNRGADIADDGLHPFAFCPWLGRSVRRKL